MGLPSSMIGCLGCAAQPVWVDMGRALVIAALLGLLAFALWVAYRQWAMVSVEIPFWGWIAILAGAGLSLVVGVGLMALVFYSSRHGYDDRVQQIERDEP